MLKLFMKCVNKLHTYFYISCTKKLHFNNEVFYFFNSLYYSADSGATSASGAS